MLMLTFKGVKNLTNYSDTNGKKSLFFSKDILNYNDLKLCIINKCLKKNSEIIVSYVEWITPYTICTPHKLLIDIARPSVLYIPLLHNNIGRYYLFYIFFLQTNVFYRLAVRGGQTDASDFRMPCRI